MSYLVAGRILDNDTDNSSCNQSARFSRRAVAADLLSICWTTGRALAAVLIIFGRSCCVHSDAFHEHNVNKQPPAGASPDVPVLGP